MQEKSRWEEDTLKKVIKENINIAQCLVALGLKPLGSNYKTLKKYANKYHIDTSHFLGQRSCLGRKRNIPKKELSMLLVENSVGCPSNLKERIVKEGLLSYKCTICNISSWINQPLVLHLDHINGQNNDNRIENLRFLCPNCHSQTSTYCGRNAKHLHAKRIINNQCLDCKSSIHSYAQRCRSCAAKLANPAKINWLPTSELCELVGVIGYSAVGRKFGVSGAAVKKRIRNHPND